MAMKGWKARMGGMQKPMRAPAKEIADHHSTDEPIKRAASVVHRSKSGG